MSFSRKLKYQISTDVLKSHLQKVLCLQFSKNLSANLQILPRANDTGSGLQIVKSSVATDFDKLFSSCWGWDILIFWMRTGFYKKSHFRHMRTHSRYELGDTTPALTPELQERVSKKVSFLFIFFLMTKWKLAC